MDNSASDEEQKPWILSRFANYVTNNFSGNYSAARDAWVGNKFEANTQNFNIELSLDELLKGVFVLNEGLSADGKQKSSEIKFLQALKPSKLIHLPAREQHYSMSSAMMAST